MAEKFKKFNVNGVEYNFDNPLTSPNGTEYELGVSNSGELYAVKNGETETTNAVTPQAAATEYITKLETTNHYKLYINSFYCGGENGDVHSLNQCSHNFVELANLTGKDINLNGTSLQYAKAGRNWIVLPLKGVIKNGETFLVRGAACSVYDYAKIKVDKFDMEWRVDNEGNYSENGELIKFSNESAKFYFRVSTDKCTVENPYNPAGTAGTVENKYIDFVGAQASTSTPVDGCEVNPRTGLLSSRIFKQYYAMDPVKQATKDLSNRDDSKWWNWVDLTKEDGDVIPNIHGYDPKASEERKTIFNGKTKLYDYKPTVITCSFGIQATDNYEYYKQGDTIPQGSSVGDIKSGEGATRCFNWLSKNLYDEFLWIRVKGTEDWGDPIESFKNETGARACYNRKTREYSDGGVVTAHRVIKKNLVAGVYEYIAGHKNKDNTPNLEACTNVRSFRVRTNAEVASGFTFVQTSDQQGFNWEEYRIWEYAARTIMDEDVNGDIEFMINTGDIAQNGNRLNEWIDYFQAEDERMGALEEMGAVGNNDLSPAELYKLGDGEDACKKSLENYEFFFTAEIDEDNPPVFTVNSVDYFIPSLYSFNYGNTHFLCMNTEIKTGAEYAGVVTKDIYASVYGFSSYGNFYPKIKEWCERDIQKNSGFAWNIAYCHEMPFTILTTGVTNNPSVSTATERGAGGKGCNANDNMPPAAEGTNNFWFSEFCQTHNYRLIMGGHKHTQSTSWPMLENVSYNNGVRNVESYMPVIVLSADNTKFANELKEINAAVKVSDTNPTSLVEVTFKGKTRKYPNTWVSNGSIVAAAEKYVYLCEFERENTLSDYKTRNGVTADTKPVLYAMSQATGYKHTSNKELPAVGIPWLRYYFGTALNTTKPLAGQKYPFYTLWTVTDSKIEGDIRKVKGAFNSNGNFDVNVDGEYGRRGYSAVEKDNVTKIHSINGFGDENGHTIIEINA